MSTFTGKEDSRALEDLHPEVFLRAKAFLEAAKEAGHDLICTSTYRSSAVQDRLYMQGRVAPGKVVTNARGGQSYHNFRCALDIVPLINGKPFWDNRSKEGRAIWASIGKIGEDCGLEWAGRWTGKFQETAHFQYTGGLTLDDLRAGKIPT